MNPAACARAKKELRLARERSMQPKPPPQSPREAHRRVVAPARRIFTGIMSRREAERFLEAAVQKQLRSGDAS